MDTGNANVNLIRDARRWTFRGSGHALPPATAAQPPAGAPRRM